jgi:hypothetical protein
MGFSHKFYKTAAWLKLRRNQLASEPLCRICLQHGVVTAASVADHVEPWRDWNSFRCNELRSLCLSCHSGLSKPGNKPKRWTGLDGFPLS